MIALICDFSNDFIKFEKKVVILISTTWATPETKLCTLQHFYQY